MSETTKENANLIQDKHGLDDDAMDIDKARNRMVAEGYKYHALDGSLSGSDTESDTVKKRYGEWKQKQRQFVCCLVCSIVLIAILASVVIWQYQNRYRVNAQLCDSQTCVKTSAYILQKMDTSVDPCSDFYSYTCGNWVKTTVIPETEPKYGTFQVIQDQITNDLKKLFQSDSVMYKGHNSTAIQKMKTYYNTCMDTDKIDKLDIQPVIEVINSFGSWTLSNTSKPWDENNWNFMDAFVKIAKTGLNDPLLGIGVSNDDRNNSVNIINIGQSGLTLGSCEQYYTNSSKYQALKDAYIDYGTRWTVYLGAEETEAKAKIEAIYNFEQQLALIFRTKEELQDPEKIYNKMSIKELQDNYLGPTSMIHIHDYINGIFGRVIPEDTQILVYTPRYLKDLTALLARTPKSVLADYMVWTTVSSLSGYLPQRFIDLALILSKVESGVTKLEPRWKRCMGKAVGTAGYAAGALYVQDYFAETSKAQVEDILEQVRAAFISNLPSVTWMDDVTRAKAAEKAEHVTKKIAYPDWILDPTKLDTHYENLTITPGEFVKSLFAVLQYSVQKNLDKLGKPPDPEEWAMMPTEVNAYYSPTYNNIAFPAGILQKPFFDPDFPIPFNFGTVGMIIGHELTHGFDNSGRKFDLNGNLHNWWTNSSIDGFKRRAGCMVKQYSSYEVEHLGIHIRGETTLGENIADNGGIKTAYHAYRKWRNSHPDDELQYPGLDLDDDQLFYVGFSQLWCSFYTPAYAKTSIVTDEHTYAKYRVIGALSNSDSFARAFHCPRNSPMNPEKKCEVW
ncbi:endothelin-converting enzyme homolog isoform X2 [Mizuhopecten yessoensis]|uniref:endothelin-converting enzyme homolog isoform X2 n=1 Tax=Mizuhopecten yessoensis TaxID=6573 RepID=UPI000B4591E3|nr:endothelin-converting enzyme homolog isoform X2 [Mizuhopecten yessoensis]